MSDFVLAEETPPPPHPVDRLADRLEELRAARHMTAAAYEELRALLVAHDSAVAGGVLAEIAAAERTYAAQNQLTGVVAEHEWRLIGQLESAAEQALSESERGWSQ